MKPERANGTPLPKWTQAPAGPRQGRRPRWMVRAALLGLAVAALPLALAARARVSTSSDPRIQLVQDMANQPKYGPQSPVTTEVFADGRAMRPRIDGTVARGQAATDDHYFRGYKTDASSGDMAFFDGFPERVKVTPELVARGQERFNIYCAICHGQDGSGNGPINVRAMELMKTGQAKWVQPANLHADAVRTLKNGSIFNAITAGVRSMPSYAAQIPVEDRWAIVAYVRALQLSQYAPADALPADQLDKLAH